MNHQAIIRPPADWRWLLPVALVLVMLFWNPVGYVGGGADDQRYLAAAQCWLAEGPCLPTNHWDARWPLVGSLTASLGLFGTSRLALALPSLLASLACLVLLKHLGDRLFGAPAGLAAAILFALLPVFSLLALSASVEPLELALILGCFAALNRPALAGVLLGLAFQLRETSIAALLPLAFLLWKDRKALLLFVAGFVAPLLVELLFFYLSTGDPLYRRTLSLRHTLIPSGELARHDRGLPLFNRSLLENWNYVPGVRIHWLVDGFANLFVNLKTGLYFVLTPLLFALYRDRIRSGERRAALFVLLGSLFYAAVLIYALSLDPKPRIMFVPLAGFALVLGLVAVRAWNAVVASALVCSAALSALCLAVQPRHLHWQRTAEQWAERYPGQIELAQPDYFIFSPLLESLPPAGSGRRYVVELRNGGCGSSARVVERAGASPLAVAFGDRSELCLFRQ